LLESLLAMRSSDEKLSRSIRLTSLVGCFDAPAVTIDVPTFGSALIAVPYFFASSYRFSDSFITSFKTSSFSA
jgi:hypothetical protein